jgi:4'-phosphopantetheinyl transferase
MTAFEFSEHSVHVWTVYTRAPNSVSMKFESVLSRDEKDRTARFRYEHLRKSFVVTRGVLRSLLGHYVGHDPASVRFKYGCKGKPELASPTGIEFNVTHSAGFAAFAFIIGCEVGIDVELVRPLVEMQNIADRVFCPEEAAEIMSLQASEREVAFFCCWTRKEAYIKAIGDGLSAPLDNFRVTVRSNEPARFIHIANDTNAAQAWTLHDLQLAPKYAGALAYRGERRFLSVFPVVDPSRFTAML